MPSTRFSTPALLARIFVFLLTLGVAGPAALAELVGTLPGSLSVDNKGAANYSVPLAIPPGRSGLQPALALNYNSSGGNGPLGIGFSLSTGFPQAITRGRSILARDGVVRGVTFTADDKFYLDGKRLICVAGTYGLAPSTYRTEVDSFVEIVAPGTGNIETFVVTDKNGTKMTFGKITGATDGYQTGNLATSSSETLDTLAYTWALKRVEDTLGNYCALTYAYVADGEWVLDRLDYNPVGTSSTCRAKVAFAYSARSDADRRYVFGRRFANTRRLDTITASFDTGVSVKTTASYALGYELSPGAGLTRLKTVTASLADPQSGTLVALPATTFTWSDAAVSYGSAVTITAPPTSSDGVPVHFWGDVDGDGFDDLVYAQTTGLWVRRGSSSGLGTAYQALSASWSLNVMFFKPCDTNGDGRKDVVVGLASIDSGGGLFLYQSDGTNFVAVSGGPQVYSFATPSDDFADPVPPASGRASYFVETEKKAVGNRVTLADFNGDGRDDILIHRYDGKFRYMYSNGAGFDAAVTDGGADGVPMGASQQLDGTFRFLGYLVTSYYAVTPLPCDINGDGRADYAWLTTKTIMDGSVSDPTGGGVTMTLEAKLALPGGGFTARQVVWTSTCYGNQFVPMAYRQNTVWAQPCDVNGDGLTDFAVTNSSTPNETVGITVRLSRGTGDTATFDDIILPRVLNISGNHIAPVFDKIARSEFTSYSYDDVIDLDEGLVPLWHSLLLSSSGNNMIFDDVDGDGRSDYVWYKQPSSSAPSDHPDTMNVDTLASNYEGWAVIYSRGGSFAKPVAAPLGYDPTPRYSHGSTYYINTNERADIDGNGLPDIVNLSSTYESMPALANYRLNTCTRGNLLTAVTDGLGRTTQVAYKAAKDASLYTPGAAVTYPIRELRSAQPVVSDAWHDSGATGSPAHFSYQYSGNRLDLSGRGSLGFHSFVTLDHQTGLLKYQFLAQSFPMTGLTHREETYRWWNTGSHDKFRFLSSHDNTVVFDTVSTGGGVTVWPFISKAIEYRWENGDTEHFAFTSATVNSQPEALFTAGKAASAHIVVVAESLFDAQTAVQTTLPASGYSPSDFTGTANSVKGTTVFDDVLDAFSGPSSPYGKISYGNLKVLRTDYGYSNGSGVVTVERSEKVVTNYDDVTSNGIAGRVHDVQTSTWGGGYGTSDSTGEKSPQKTFTYWTDGSTPTSLVSTELVDATTTKDSDGTPGSSTLNLTTTYNRGTRGRVTSTQISSPDTAIGAYTVFTAADFDDRWDTPTSTQNNYGHTTTTVYHDFLGVPTSVTDVNGAQVTTTYDALGRVATVTDVLKGLSTTNTYYADGTVTVSGSVGLGLTSAYRIETTATAKPTVKAYYDRLGRVIRVTKEGFGDQVAITDTLYNVLGQVVAVSLPYLSGGTKYWTTTTYDALGRVATVTAPNGTVTTNTYAGRTTTVSVDAPNLGGVNPAAQANATLVDAKGRTVSVWNADNIGDPTPSISFDLDGFGRMRATTLKDQTQQITAKYDALGRQTQLADPDKGTWNYVNNALGQVVSQTDARGTVTLSTFDRLGRPLSRTATEPSSGPVETANFYYYDTSTVTTASQHTVAKGTQGWIGAPEREEADTTGAPGFDAPATVNLHYYDAKGRPAIDLAQTDGKWFYTYTHYDAYSRPQSVRHYWKPAAAEDPGTQPYVWQDFGYAYAYDSKSYLLGIADSLGRPWWAVHKDEGYDHLDRPVKVQKGNGPWTQRTYRATDGVLTAIATGATVGATGIQNLGFSYDGLGNLTSRSDAHVTSGSETLTYDNLNRLETTKQGTISYQPNGNILNKPDVSGAGSSGDYTYDTVRPHAVKTAFGYAMTYDGNGNVLTRSKSGNVTTVAYAGFDKPRWMAKTAATLTSTPVAAAGSEFHYNAGRSRVMQLEFTEAKDTGPTQYNRKRLYALGSTLELNYTTATPSASPTWNLDTVRVYVPGPDGIVGAREFRPASGGSEKALVYHYDHLGSITAITDWGVTGSYSIASGNKTGRYSEDAWGQRRDPLDWSGAPTAATDDGGADSLTPRGFTGHEMLDDLGLVHMNGRIYDPLLGRFLTADLIVQTPGSLQSYNRYSYVMNNPLTLFDPTGFASATPVLDAIIGTLNALAAPVVMPYRTVFDNDRLTTEVANGWQTDSAASESAGRNGTLGALNRFNPMAQIYNGVAGEDLSNNQQLNTEQRWQNGVGGAYGTALLVAPALGKGPVMAGRASAQAAATVSTEASEMLSTAPKANVTAAAPQPVATGGAISAAPATDLATVARNALVVDTEAAGVRTQAIVGVQNAEGTISVAATNGDIPAVIHPELAAAAEALGGVGTRTAAGNVVGRCAEFRGANQALLDGGGPLSGLGITSAIRVTPTCTRYLPRCDNCVTLFGPEL